MSYVKKEEVLKIVDSTIHSFPDRASTKNQIRDLKTYKGSKKVEVTPAFCPNDCCYLMMNQDEQDEWFGYGYELKHLCNKYHKEVIHYGGKFPELKRVEGCEEL